MGQAALHTMEWLIKIQEKGGYKSSLIRMILGRFNDFLKESSK
jgi:hypothetical protein